MKKVFTLGFILALFFSVSSSAQTLLTEDFTGAAGTVVTTTGWTAHSGGTTNAVTIVSPGLTYTGYSTSGNAASLTTSGQDINKALSDSINSGSLYASLLVNVTSAQANGDYFFNLMTNPSNTFALVGRVYVKLATSTGKISFGISKSSTNASFAPVYSDSVYSTGTTYLLVVKYTVNPDTLDDVASLFINPALSANEPLPTLTSTTTSSTGAEPVYFGAVALRQGSGTAAANIIVDGIKVAKTWADVAGYPLITIAEARVDANTDGIPDKWRSASDRDTVHIQGIVFTPNYQTSHRSYYIWDGTAGIATFKSGLLSPALNLGDKVDIVGYIDYFNALTEIAPVSDLSIIVLSDSNTVPEYQLLTIPQFYANPEAYEGELVAFKNLTKTSGTWPSTGASVNLTFKNGSDSIIARIDSDTDIDGKTEPVYPVDIIGVITQFSSGANNVGYQIQPRYYATDFLPGGTVPVELTSFTANYSGSVVSLKWATATEKNNRGFEVQKKSNGTFETVAFVSGNGTTTEKHTYSYSDKDVKNGSYTYRLKQVDFDGSFEYSKEAEVEIVQPKVFALEQNYPNPFNPSTTINFSLAVDSKISLKLFNILGQEITTLINSSYAAGAHQFKFNASLLNSGVYFYKLEANGIDGSAYNSVRKMMLAK